MVHSLSWTLASSANQEATGPSRGSNSPDHHDKNKDHDENDHDNIENYDEYDKKMRMVIGDDTSEYATESSWGGSLVYNDVGDDDNDYPTINNIHEDCFCTVITLCLLEAVEVAAS